MYLFILKHFILIVYCVYTAIEGPGKMIPKIQ
jgi:hypothetical protein